MKLYSKHGFERIPLSTRYIEGVEEEEVVGAFGVMVVLEDSRGILYDIWTSAEKRFGLLVEPSETGMPMISRRRS